MKYILIFVLFFTQNSQAQDSLIEKFNTYLAVYENQFADLSYALNRGLSEHELYINKNWATSVLKDLNGKMVAFSGRYNVLLGVVEINLNGRIRAINPRKIEAIKVGPNVLVPEKFRLPNKSERKEFFELLTDSYPMLLKRHYIDSEITGGNSLSASVTGERKSFVATNLYYKLGKDTKSLTLPKSKKGLAKIFTGIIDSSDWFKTNEFKFKNEANIIDYFEAMTGT